MPHANWLASTWGTGTGLYPYLKSIYGSSAPQAISGFAYLADGTTTAVGAQVGIYGNGYLLNGGTVTTGTGSNLGYTLHTFTSTGASTLSLSALNAVFSGNITGAGSLTANPAAGGKFTFTGTNSYAGMSQLICKTICSALGLNEENCLSIASSNLCSDFILFGWIHHKEVVLHC